MSASNQPVDPSKPDLEETINVGATHAAVDRANAAVTREKNVRENGMEPISIWTIVSLGIIALIGGGVLVKASFFGYNDDVLPGYVRGEKPGGAEEITGAAMDIYMKKGAALYAQCAACHGQSGEGNSAPPLAGSERATSHPTVLAMIPLNGIEGTSMGAFAAGLEPFEFAALMTYIRNSFGNSDGKVFSVEMYEEVKALSAARANAGKPVTVDELKNDFAIKLAAKPLKAETKVSAKTGLPVEE